MLRLGIYNCDRTLRAIGDDAADFSILQQKCRGAKDHGDDQRRDAETPGQPAIN
ncbi:MAG: hypothetical protein JSU67_10835 [Gammaproteobacteria bacterium]|nr:MAG: hypothetical protein JSU67_10835 [Gammaproteobacteria bacterium]